MNSLRPCIADNQKAFFHTWEQYSEIVPPSPMVGGHSGGVLTCVLAIVELEDGAVKRFEVSDIKFTDREAAVSIPEKHNAEHTEKLIKTNCPFCEEKENTNALLFADKENKEYFVYCELCGIETTDVYKSKTAALNAFNSGENKKVKEGCSYGTE